MALAREAQARGYDYLQNSISNWMRGVHAAPRDLPPLLNEIYDLSAHEWLELAVAFAYGRRFWKEDLQKKIGVKRQWRLTLKQEDREEYTPQEERSLHDAISAQEDPWEHITSPTRAENG